MKPLKIGVKYYPNHPDRSKFFKIVACLGERRYVVDTHAITSAETDAAFFLRRKLCPPDLIRTLLK